MSTVLDKPTKSESKRCWRTDKPRIGRLVEVRYADLEATRIVSGRWWGMDGWQLVDSVPGYLIPTFAVEWRPLPDDHEVKLLVQYLLNSLWHDLAAIPVNLVGNVKAIIREMRQ